MKHPQVKNYIGGGFVDFVGEHADVISPHDGSPLSSVPLAGAAEVDAAVQAAANAFPDWSAKTIKGRAQVAYRYRDLLHQHIDELSQLIYEEHGKTRNEAEEEIIRAIEVTEFACSLPQLVAGEVLEVSPGVECRVDRLPLGVVASIAPFNFPMMVPHWTIPMAGCAGQRCMAAASMIAVGDAEKVIKEVCAEARKMVPGKNIGPVISGEAKTRIESYIAQAEQAGAKILVDGRNTVVAERENGCSLHSRWRESPNDRRASQRGHGWRQHWCACACRTVWFRWLEPVAVWRR